MASITRCGKTSVELFMGIDPNLTNSSFKFSSVFLGEVYENTTVPQIQLVSSFLLFFTTLCICAYLINLLAIFISKVWADQPQFVQLIGHGMFDVISLCVSGYELLSSVVMHESMLSELGSKNLFLVKQYFLHAEYALLFVISVIRAFAILKPLKIRLIFTWRVALGSVLIVALVYSPVAIFLSLDCMVGYKPRVLTYDIWLAGPLPRMEKWGLLTADVIIPEVFLRVPLIFLTSLSYSVAITSLIYQKLKLKHIISHDHPAGSSNVPQLNFRAELNLIFIGYWPVLMHTVSRISLGRYPPQIFGLLGTVVIARVGVTMFNGSTPFIQLITSSQIRQSVVWLWGKLARRTGQTHEVGKGKQRQQIQAEPPFHRVRHHATGRRAVCETRFIEAVDNSSYHTAHRMAPDASYDEHCEESYQSVNPVVLEEESASGR